MPTRGGWLLALSSVLAGLCGRLLGLEELFVIAAGGGALVLSSVAYVWARRSSLDARRTLAPERVPVGGSCRVELAITNRGRRATPLLGVEDGVEGQFLLAPLLPAEAVRPGYAFHAARRGLQPVGPLRVQTRDPFGLAVRSRVDLAPSMLTVHPCIEPVELPDEPPGAAGGDRSHTPAASRLPGGDFHALRPYEHGDDLRLVHWPTTARLDALVVRQDETARLRQTLVVLDLRRPLHDAGSIERAISAAASVMAASCGDDGLARLVTTGGVDSGTAGGDEHLAAVLDMLATVDQDGASDLAALATALEEEPQGATVVVVTTSAVSPGDLGALARLRLVSAQMVAVLVEPATRRPAPAGALPVLFDAVVTVAPEECFADVWTLAVSEGHRIR